MRKLLQTAYDTKIVFLLKSHGKNPRTGYAMIYSEPTMCLFASEHGLLYTAPSYGSIFLEKMVQKSSILTVPQK